jgi:hypothetical protein
MIIEIETPEDLNRLTMIADKNLFNPFYDTVYIIRDSEAFLVVKQHLLNIGILYRLEDKYVGYMGVVFQIKY